eukprot:712797-Pelagomonas_calceolata.AAC.1
MPNHCSWLGYCAQLCVRGHLGNFVSLAALMPESMSKNCSWLEYCAHGYACMVWGGEDLAGDLVTTEAAPIPPCTENDVLEAQASLHVLQHRPAAA